MSKQHFKLDHFIEKVFIGNIGKIVNDNNHYLSFPLIAQGIELLGTIIEEIPDVDFNKRGNSRVRFRKGLTLFDNSEYLNYSAELNRNATDHDLYSHLRCGFAHQMRPTGKLGLTHDEEMEREGTEHLKLNDESRLVLNIDILYKDFKKACEKVVDKIRNKEINHEKAYQNFLSIDKST